jgi:hypothetical protein
MKCSTVYDLCRVIVEQADALERALNRFDSALADEATDALADDPDIYKDDDECWGDH